MPDGEPDSDLMKLVEVHKDGYYLFVGCDTFYKPMGPGGCLNTLLLRKDEVNIVWVRSGPNLAGSHLCGHELESDWFLNEPRRFSHP